MHWSPKYSVRSQDRNRMWTTARSLLTSCYVSAGSRENHVLHLLGVLLQRAFVPRCQRMPKDTQLQRSLVIGIWQVILFQMLVPLSLCTSWSPLWGIQTTRSKPSLGTGWCALSWFNYLLLGIKKAKTRETRCAYSTTVKEVSDGRSIDWCKQVECMHGRHAPATHGIDLFIFQLLPLSRWWATLSIITFVASDRCALKGPGIQTMHFQSGTITWKVWRLGLSRTWSPGEIHSVMGRLADLNIVICLPQVFNTPEQLVNEVYVTWIDRIEWEIRSQIPRLFCDTHCNQNDTVFGIAGLLVPTCMPCFESGQPENTAHWPSVNMFRKHRVLATLTCWISWMFSESDHPFITSQEARLFVTFDSFVPTPAWRLTAVDATDARRAFLSHSCSARTMCELSWRTADGGISKDKGYPVHQVKSEKEDDHGGLYHDFFCQWSKKKHRKYSPGEIFGLGFHCWVVLNRCPGLSLGRPTS